MKINALFRKFYQRHTPLVFWLLFFLIYFPVVSFVVVTLVLLGYIFWPFTPYQISVPQSESTHVIVVSHGLKDNADSWAIDLKEALKEKNPQAEVIALDWQRYADNAFTCSVNGRRIGEIVAKKLMANQHLKRVEVIGHSCGAFVNLGICEGLKSQTLEGQSVIVNSVYLDPVSVYGGVFWHYGLNHFGQCADASNTYFDTDDNVPGSNQAPKHSQGVDITALKSEANFLGKPHTWPIYYYIEQIKNATLSTSVE
ncbi:alpha/beta hydrolase [Thalassotalea marina]|uniref:Lipase domain-containing protein n=1 Tax=Thalassotalea marina TaxID=1673741 RepID=A0A919BM82_9GAMM|nr:hypothetical protein [Thalassotalea marina]GHF97051.1 hypothetical protein GCM10017161_26450 [Thalassotalea marina]